MKTLIVILIAFSAQFVTAQTNDFSWLKGYWEGSGYQPNSAGDTYWDISLKYVEETDNFGILYPSLYCGGNWKLVRADKRTAEFVETITMGKDKCMNQMAVLVEYINENEVKVTFFTPNTNVIDAAGILKRKK